MRATILMSFLMLSLLFSAGAAGKESAFNLDEAKKRCRTHHTQSEKLHRDEFRWNYTLPEMEERFHQIYASPKRLSFHADYNAENDCFYLYYATAQSTNPVRITANFINSVTVQIETAIAKGYAGFVFFPDMGHAHLYFPLEHWQQEYAHLNVSTNKVDKLYEKMLADEQMKPLYHLSEQLRMTDEKGQVLADEILRFKYWNRNFVGRNNGTPEYAIYIAPDTTRYNTVCSLENHKSWSAGFAVSANERGCFPYRDKDGTIRYFDISLYEPPYRDPAWICRRPLGSFLLNIEPAAQ